MKRIIFIIICLFHITTNAQNPVVPPGVYIADPSAHVWKDGRLYIYGSLDEACSYYCSWRHHVMATDDMKNWDIYKNVFYSKGEKDEVPYNDALLFAPDCQYKDGKYYLYYCMPDKNSAEGVAVSESSTGPFKNGQKIGLGGHNQIDPSLFIDDDGQAYYLWGQFTLKMAKMNPNMKELDLETIRDSILTEKDHFFHEGAYLTKREDTYYLVYADISRAEMPTCIGYATSKNPFGPYQYGGVIVDNSQCNPGNWNNHGSIANFKGQWYVFYHRSTHGCNKMRKSCVEPIFFDKNGAIPEVEMTSQGAGPPLNAKKKTQAEMACILHGNVRIQLFEEGNEELALMNNGDKAVYKYINFGEGIKEISLRIAPGPDGGRIVVSADKPWHKKLATFDVEGSDINKWQTVTKKCESITGIHALWLTFYGKGDDMFRIDYLQFH